MSLAAELETLRSYPDTASGEFREQLERMRSRTGAADSNPGTGRGVDRSRELSPIARPSILRSQNLHR